MMLPEAKLNVKLIVKDIKLDSKIKFRLMELGLIPNCKIAIKKRSMFKKTLLVVFHNSCFTINSNIAKGIEVVDE